MRYTELKEIIKNWDTEQTRATHKLLEKGEVLEVYRWYYYQSLQVVYIYGLPSAKQWTNNKFFLILKHCKKQFKAPAKGRKETTYETRARTTSIYN